MHFTYRWQAPEILPRREKKREGRLLPTFLHERVMLGVLKFVKITILFCSV